MNADRRQFSLGLTTAFFSLGLHDEVRAQSAQGHVDVPSGASRRPYFFKNPTFEYVFLVSLGRAYQMAGNVGKVLYLTRQIEDGNFERDYQDSKKLGDEGGAL